ncbi:AMP-binding protein [bacterium]|nr:AMP-binding protein [bacterium]
MVTPISGHDLIADNQYNIGHICTRHQCELGRADKLAMKWIGPRGETSSHTFAQLDRESSKCARVLLDLGLVPGDVFFIFLPKVPEVYFAFLGALKAQIIVGPLFSNFGDEALLDRMSDSGARAILARKSYLKKLLRIRGQLPELKYILVTDIDEHQGDGVLSLPKLMSTAPDDFVAPLTPPETPSVLHYTSGSTGKPKGALHGHRSVLMQNRTVREVLQLRDDDLYWCTADHGWVTGVSYGIIGPWSQGVSQIHFGGAYDPRQWFELLQNEKVTAWYTAPTALRMLMREPDEFFREFDLSPLRDIFSVGEPLNPEVVLWGRRLFGKDIYDTWWQTETGAIMIASRPGREVIPACMGRPLDGIEAAIIADDGTPAPVNEQGSLCLKPGWDSMFIAYYKHEDIYRSKFKNGWYFSGDTARRDEAGNFWFMGRSDDVINTSGHLVSPFEVESALLEIEGVAESGVIAAPDPMLFEKVVAFVSMKPGCEWNEDIELKARLHVSNRVSTMATPQEFIVLGNIPKTKSGKIMRRVLKARYLGTELGDISTMDV